MVVDARDPLDNAIWQALTTFHASFAEGNELAKRYPPAVGPLAAVEEPSSAGYEALRQIVPPGEVAALVLPTPTAALPGWTLLFGLPLAQMVCNTSRLADSPHAIEELGREDIPEMLALTELTKPGPFGPRTAELGTYLGIRQSGRLVAMAGLRLRLPGFSEISAVCTHPDHTGRGYARSLTTALVKMIQNRAEVAFLHVRPDNTPAVHVYEKLGFRLQRLVHLAVLKREKV